jgi:SAM-dependent methyltransferase
MADLQFEHPRLAGIYDVLDGERDDLQVYLRVAEAESASSVLDVGCGTGSLALMLAQSGVEVIGLEPAAAMLAVAQHKAGAQRVRWIHGEISSLPEVEVDLALMTGNVAQAITDPIDWDHILTGIFAALRPGGLLVFETRDPTAGAWEDWTKPRTQRVVEIDGVGLVDTWTELTEVDLPLVSFRATFHFRTDGAVLTSESTLRYRDPHEIQRQLAAHGFALEAITDAPDRPGRELVVAARRP